MKPIDEGREPAADLRTSARQLREYYIALVREGFTESEALQIIGMVLSGLQGGREK